MGSSKRFLWVAAAAMLAVSACSSSAATPGAAGTGAAGTKPLTIGVINFSSTDVAVNAEVTGIQTAAKALGWTVNVVDSQASVDQGNTAMEDMVQKKVDAIMELVLPATSLTAGIAAANAANIPVISMGGGMADGVAAELDDAQGGPVADDLIKVTGGTGQILALEYKEGLPCRMRYQTLEDELGAYPNLDMETQNFPIPGQVEAATALTTAWIEAHPNGTGIWTCVDDAAEGAVAAEKQLGLTKPLPVWGFNGDTAAIELVQSGWMAGTLWIDHNKMGEDGLNLISQIIAAGASWKPKTVETTFTLITPANVAQFEQDHPDWNQK